MPRTLKVSGAILGVLFGLSGGLAVSAAVMAADVQSAYDRLTAATDGPDALMYTDERSPEQLRSDLRRVDGIEDATGMTFFEIEASTTGDQPVLLGPVEEPCNTGTGDIAATPHTDGWRGREPQMVLGEGRFPEAGAREAVLPTITARRLDLRVGDHIAFAGECLDNGEFQEVEQPIKVRISGIGTSIFDGAEVGDNFAVENILISERLSDELEELGMEPNPGTVVWVEGSAGISDVRGLPADAGVALDMVEVRESVRGDLAPDATALRVFAAIVAVSALVILGPMLARLVRANNATSPTLRALGMSRRSLVAVDLIRGTVVGLVVALATVGAAAAFATRLPIGAAREFEGTLPFAPGVLRSVVGAIAVAAVAISAMGLTSWLWHRRGGAARRPPAPRVSRIVSTLGLRPPSAAGVRFALEPGSRDDGAPVRSGLTTAAVAVAAVAGVITFSASLDHLRETPRLYGVNSDVFTILEDPDAMARALESDPEVEALSRVTFFPPQGAVLGDDRTEVWLMSFEAGPDSAEPSIISGRAPEADHEVMLSRDLSDALGAGIGDVVPLHLPRAEAMHAQALEQPWDGPDERVTELEVVGIGVLPIGDGRLGQGASMTFTGLQRAIGPTTSPESLRIVEGASPDVLTRVLQENIDSELTAEDVAAMSSEEVLAQLTEPFGVHGVAFDAGGPEVAATKAIEASDGDLERRDFAEELTPERVVSLDLSQAGRIPDTFSGLMAVVAVVVVALLVAIGGRQRRHELGVLRSLGFGPRQVRRSFIAQAVTTVLAASLLVPVGIVVGRAAWLAYAEGLGVVPEAQASPLLIAPALGILLVITLVVALIASRFHERRPLATDLRPPE